MPKVPTQNAHTPAPGTRQGNLNKGHPNVLKRNQACHQCRKRKLKCDAKRPCTTCVRSYSHAVNHGLYGDDPPAHPECTYDEVDVSPPVNEARKTKYEKLESRINELEALLHQQETAQRSTSSSSDDLNPSRSPENTDFNSFANFDSSFASIFNGNGTPASQSPFNSTDTSIGTTNIITPDPGLTIPGTLYGSGIDKTGSVKATIESPFISSEPGQDFSSVGLPQQDLVLQSWPLNLPNPDFTRHLVEAFFSCHPHACRLFHVPTFMVSISFPPRHACFPNTAILHAICAMGSLYTAAVERSDVHGSLDEPIDTLFPRKYRKNGRVDSFAEQQADYSKHSADEQLSMGENLFDVFRARVILTWYYWTHARWCDVYMSSVISLRLAVTCGLNGCPPFQTIGRSIRPLSLLERAESILEDETRRNAFWMAYCTERSFGFANGWALSLDDLDVSQLLPVQGDEYNQGILVQPQERQWSHSKDLFFMSPDDRTDSFTLYVKANLLISKTKNFNLRFRVKHYTGEMDCLNTAPNPEYVDPRNTCAFLEIDGQLKAFRSSFPRHLRSPFNVDSVDVNLYSACLAPHVAIIILHEPHARLESGSCYSAREVYQAAADILSLVHAILSTSFDFTLLDNFASFSWYMAGRVFVRFLGSGSSASFVKDKLSDLRDGINAFRVALSRMGERIPLAYRYGKMLEDHYIRTCGESPPPPMPTLAPRWPMRQPDYRGIVYNGAALDGIQTMSTDGAFMPAIL